MVCMTWQWQGMSAHESLAISVMTHVIHVRSHAIHVMYACHSYPGIYRAKEPWQHYISHTIFCHGIHAMTGMWCHDMHLYVIAHVVRHEIHVIQANLCHDTHVIPCQVMHEFHSYPDIYWIKWPRVALCQWYDLCHSVPAMTNMSHNSCHDMSFMLCMHACHAAPCLFWYIVSSWRNDHEGIAT